MFEHVEEMPGYHDTKVWMVYNVAADNILHKGVRLCRVT